jgi:hypothetical protein
VIENNVLFGSSTRLRHDSVCADAGPIHRLRGNVMFLFSMQSLHYGPAPGGARIANTVDPALRS